MRDHRPSIAFVNGWAIPVAVAKAGQWLIEELIGAGFGKIPAARRRGGGYAA